MQVIVDYYQGRARRIIPAYYILLAIHCILHRWLSALPQAATFEGRQVSDFWLMGHPRCESPSTALL